MVEAGHRAYPKPQERNNSDALRLIARFEELGILPQSDWFKVDLTAIESKRRGPDAFIVERLWADGYLSRKPAGSRVTVGVAESELVPEMPEEDSG